MTRRDAVAEDIAQETLLRAFLHFDELDPNRSAWPWLKKVATRLVYDHARNQRDVCSDPSNDGVVPDTAGVYADRDFVRQMLGALPDRQRTAVTLRYIDDWKSAEIATVLNLPRPAVEQLLMRARRSLHTEYRRLSGDRLRLALWPLLGWSMRLRHRLARGAEAFGDAAWLPSMGAAADSLSALVIAGALTVGATFAANPPATTMAAGAYDADVRRVASGVATSSGNGATTLPKRRTASVAPAPRTVEPRAASAQAAEEPREDVGFSAASPLPRGSNAEPLAHTSLRRDHKTVKSDSRVLIDVDGHQPQGGFEVEVICDAGTVAGTTCQAYDAAVTGAPETP